MKRDIFTLVMPDGKTYNMQCTSDIGSTGFDRQTPVIILNKDNRPEALSLLHAFAKILQMESA
jgi:hypothetical protein